MCVLVVDSHITAVESALSRELQNGRLFRLLTQLNWITERPQSAKHSDAPTLTRVCPTYLHTHPLTLCSSLHSIAVCWATDSGVQPATAICSPSSATVCFHSESADGRPLADLSFVVDQLNRLDVASSEKAMLSSRDGEAMLIVRYADMKQAVQQAMHELLMAGATHGVQQQQTVGADGGGGQQQHQVLL